MASSPVKFLFALLVLAAAGWVIFVFAAKLLAWFLSRILRASVQFRVAGCTCLRDISVKFPMGAVESLSIGEIKLSKSLLKLGFSFISGGPKLQLLICDLELVLRTPEPRIKKSKPRKPPSAGRGKWMLLTNIARFLSISVTELVLKAPKAGTEIKELRLDISKSGGPNPILYVKLYLNPLLVQICDSHISSDHSGFEHGDYFLTGQTTLDITEKDSAPFVFEDLSLAFEFGHDREQGIKTKNLDLTSGNITVNLNENMLLKTKKKPEASVGSTLITTAIKKTENNEVSSLLRKPIIPEKLQFA